MKGNENIVVDHVGEGGVKQDITYILLRNFFNLRLRRIHNTRDTHSSC